MGCWNEFRHEGERRGLSSKQREERWIAARVRRSQEDARIEEEPSYVLGGRGHEGRTRRPCDKGHLTSWEMIEKGR